MSTDKIVIFCVNDVYSLENFGRLCGLIKERVVATSPAAHFVTMAGDFLSPSLLSSIDKGRLKVSISFSHLMFVRFLL